MARRIIIDTDPGQDDAVAILLALASPEDFEVLGIVAVAGNVPLALTEKNARRIVELAGRTDVPVHAGCVRPMVRQLRTAEHVHGRTGLDGYALPEPTMPSGPEARCRFHRRHGDGGAGGRRSRCARWGRSPMSPWRSSGSRRSPGASPGSS